MLSRLAGRLRGEPSDVNLILPFEEAVAALGRLGERRLGLRMIPLDAIVGTVDRAREFDRSFRPTTGRTRARWERIASAHRRGEEIPPIDVYQLGEVYFVRDGHHRVSVARALGWADIQAYVTEIRTRVGADRELRLHDLPLKSHERTFQERVPLPPEARGAIVLSDPSNYDVLAEGIEAWGYRYMQSRRSFATREEVARAWFHEEFRPVVAMLREADLLGTGTAAEGYMRLAAERYRLVRSHAWDEEIVSRLRSELR
jgi:hypothetical protein